MGHRMIQGEIVVQILMQLEKNWKLHCGEVHTLLKKNTVGPARVSGGSFDMRINYLSMPFIFGHVFGA